jgi:NADH:ubiquinone oxidoreductase subunit F (NADH-binding)
VRWLDRRFVEKFVPPEITELDVREIPLDINVSRALNIMIGAGLVIYGTGADVLSEALALSRFFRNESCGKCVPCRIGSQKITEMGERLALGEIGPDELTSMQDAAVQLSQVMKATSICGLGQVASNPMRSLLTLFPERVQQATRTLTSASKEDRHG